MPILKSILNNNPVSYANAYINPYSNYNTIKRCKDKIIKFNTEHTSKPKTSVEIENFKKDIKTNGECSKILKVTASLDRLINDPHKIEFDTQLDNLANLAISISREEYNKLSPEEKKKIEQKKIEQNLEHVPDYDPNIQVDLHNRGGKKSRKNKKRKNRKTRHNKRKSRK
jgi:hypothetical protein